MEIKIFNDSVEKFIQSLEKQTIAKVIHMIDLLEKFGNGLGMPHSKKISDKLFELRILGKNNIRIIYTYHGGKIVLLHGFVKKSFKIPKKEINLASKRLKSIE